MHWTPGTIPAIVSHTGCCHLKKGLQAASTTLCASIDNPSARSVTSHRSPADQISARLLLDGGM